MQFPFFLHTGNGVMIPENRDFPVDSIQVTYDNEGFPERLTVRHPYINVDVFDRYNKLFELICSPVGYVISFKIRDSPTSTIYTVVPAPPPLIRQNAIPLNNNE